MLYGVYVKSGDENRKPQMRIRSSSDANFLFVKNAKQYFCVKRMLLDMGLSNQG